MSAINPKSRPADEWRIFELLHPDRFPSPRVICWLKKLVNFVYWLSVLLTCFEH